MPHTVAEDACQLILRSLDIPFWPQLPRRSFRESMILQYSEGMPYVRVNESDEVAWVMRDQSDELERFYESSSETMRLAISEDYSRGFHTFVEMVKSRHFAILKGHVTGPLTFTLGLKDNQGRQIYFDEELREIALMVLQAKARWQIDVLKQFADTVVIFIDEPILSAIGSSSYLGVDGIEVVRLLQGMVSAIEGAGGVSGIHCCGRADWPLVMQSGATILNFDAYDYFDTLAIYRDDVTAFLQRGGYLAWGIVPTSGEIDLVDDEQLTSKLRSQIASLSKAVPPDLLNAQVLLTPSCGTGTRSVPETIKVFQLLFRLRESMG